jgi:hypothetical protein
MLLPAFRRWCRSEAALGSAADVLAGQALLALELLGRALAPALWVHAKVRLGVVHDHESARPLTAHLALPKESTNLVTLPRKLRCGVDE